MPKRSRPNEGNDNPTRGADKARWTRIMNRRREDFANLDTPKIKTILNQLPQAPDSSVVDDSNGNKSPKDPKEQLEDKIWEHMEIAGDETQPTSRRRQSWGVITSTFDQVDVQLNRTSRYPQSTIATARSVLDRANLSATSSIVPAAFRAGSAVGTNLAHYPNPAGTTRAAAALAGNPKPVHRAMQQQSRTISTTNTTATGTTSTSYSATTTTALLGTTSAQATHSIMLGRRSSSTPSATVAAPRAIAPLLNDFNNNTAATTTKSATGASGVSTTTTTTAATLTRRPSATNGTSTHLSVTRRPSVNSNNQSAILNTTTSRHQLLTTSTTNNRKPVHSALQGKSSSVGAAPAVPAIGASATARTSSASASVPPAGQKNATGTAAATTSTARPGSLPPATNSITATSGSTAPNNNNVSLPLHWAMQRNSSSGGSTRTTGAGAITATTSGSSQSHNPFGSTSTPPTTATATGSPFTSYSSSGTSHVPPTDVRKHFAGGSTMGQHNNELNGQVSAFSNRNGTATAKQGGAFPTSNAADQRNTVDSSSASKSASKNSRTQTGTQALQTSQSNSGSSATLRTAATSAAATSQSQTRPQQNVSQPPAAAQPQANNQSTTSANDNRKLTTSGQNTASTTAAPTAAATTAIANGMKPSTNSTAASSANKPGKNGMVPNGAGDKSKENKKPTLAKKKKIPERKLELSKKISKICLPADKGEGGKTGCFFQRPKCTVNFFKYSHVPGTPSVVKRFACSEPYWSTVQLFELTMMAKVDSIEWQTGMGTNLNEPKTAWSKILFGKHMSDIADKVKKWGAPRDNPENLEHRLLLRMLPVKVDEKMKKKRADCHLWPKGTMLVVDGKVQPLVQRKQQSHDKSEWKFMCKHFDLSSVISFPLANHTIQVCCLDPEQYYVSLELCQYRPPEFHVRKLLGMEPECKSPPLHHKVQRLSLPASKKIAKELINQQAIVLDDDDGNAAKSGGVVGKFVFSLIDPVNKGAMKIPVRGKKCKHWQCFDLETFMKSNITVYGSRWRCPCCEQFLSYNELQLCALTEAALEKFKDQVTPNRGRVEYRVDESYELLPEDRLRHTAIKRQSSVSGGGDGSGVQPKQSPSELRPRPSTQEIEIIEIDSD
ncbi:unnamed protein product [Cylindrotheca closterium]|uniref:SP-RING-type domain-containing protein n=1 Tax=Cylindrotheca closterium TaxID=2856 RepID=A0AAD2FJ05_9STRA|nr:unnamed protein product [Cylindrotheca closterium]